MAIKVEPDYILYLDETGDHTFGESTDIGKRYLGVAGPIIKTADLSDIEAALETLKRNHLPCEHRIPVLHRKEIMQSRGAFACLRLKEKRAAFDTELLTLVRDEAYTLIGVVIDKNQHGKKKYRTLVHPYHYCLHALLERYCKYLNRSGMVGHVVAESRGKVEDHQLKEEYRHVYTNGTRYLLVKEAQRTLLCKELEVRKKEENICGLQLADMLAHPVTRDVLFSYRRIESLGTAFTQQMIDALKPKYHRHPSNGTINGCGRIILS